MKRESIAGLRLALAAGFIALCVFAVALLGAAAWDTKKARFAGSF